jgi:ribosomal protein S12 methylthiotransferase accessory factor
VELADLPVLSTGDLREDVAVCRRRIEARDLEVLVLDQTRPDIGLPVVRVLVPGLRFFRPRFAAGRLYQVPPTLGWLDAAPTEASLNPVPFFL